MTEPLAFGPTDRATSVERGRAARERLPLDTHADFLGGEPGPAGRDLVALLEAQSATRIPELVPIRYGRMLANPFTFYRGAAGVMAADLGAQPHSGLVVQLCGDAHIGNVGLFASAERQHLFDLNDFDETWPGPFEWDVKRLAASLEVAGRHRGFDRARREQIVTAAVRSYRTAMAGFAAQSMLDVWYTSVALQPGLPRLRERVPTSTWRATESVVRRSRRRDSGQAFVRLTETRNGRLGFVSDPPLLVPLAEVAPVDAAELEAWVERMLGQYRASLQSDRRLLLDRFRLVDLARKAVGVGSVGTRAWVILLLDGDGTPLVLQAKEAVASVLKQYVPVDGPHNEGQRVVEGQRLMQASSDPLLGWMRIEGVDRVLHDFYIRQFRDWKGSFELDTVDKGTLELLAYASGWTLARAHARSGDRVAIASYLGDDDTFDQAMVRFARRYAKRNRRDYATLAEAAASGAVVARPGI